MQTPPAPTAHQQRLIIFIIALASFMGALDTSIVNISLPSIAAYFHEDIGDVSWVVMGYGLVIACLLLIFGKLGDTHGFRKVYIGGFAVFTIGSLLCGLSMTLGHLIGFRLVQGLGAAALEAIGPAMIALYLPQAVRGRALGTLATAVSVAIAVGPVLGGLLTEFISWHWIFFVNIPVGVMAIVLGRKILPETELRGTDSAFDIRGTAFIVAALFFLIYPLNMGLKMGWTSPFIIGSFLLSAVFWAAFVRRECTCEEPLLNLALFGNRSFSAGTVAGSLVMLAFAGATFIFPFYLEGVKGLSTAVAGIVLTVPAVTLMIFGPLAGKISDRQGTRRLTTGAAAMTAAVFLLYTSLTMESSLPVIVIGLALLGVTSGLYFPPNMNQVLGQSPKGEEGVASSVMQTAKNIGDVLGVAVFGTVFIQAIVSAFAHSPETPHTEIAAAMLVPGFHAAFFVGAVVCAIAAALSLMARDAQRV